MTDADLAAIYAFLQTVPAIAEKVPGLFSDTDK
jgi:hypothetical protein